MKTRQFPITVNLESLFASITDDELREHGCLFRADSRVVLLHKTLFRAVEAGDREAAFQAAEEIAREMFGVQLVQRSVRP